MTSPTTLGRACQVLSSGSLPEELGQCSLFDLGQLWLLKAVGQAESLVYLGADSVVCLCPFGLHTGKLDRRDAVSIAGVKGTGYGVGACTGVELDLAHCLVSSNGLGRKGHGMGRARSGLLCDFDASEAPRVDHEELAAALDDIAHAHAVDAISVLLDQFGPIPQVHHIERLIKVIGVDSSDWRVHAPVSFIPILATAKLDGQRGAILE